LSAPNRRKGPVILKRIHLSARPNVLSTGRDIEVRCTRRVVSNKQQARASYCS
jgi:hypothetical protein